MINPTRTVGEIAVELPQATRIFERLKIDYCCGGSKPLAEACANTGVDLNTLLAMLEAETGSQPQPVIDLQKATASDLISHILTTHHVFTKAEMETLEAVITKVVGVHGANHSELQG